MSPLAQPGSRVLGVWRAETRKLLAQVPARLLILVCLLGPFAFGLILSEQPGVPADTLLGVWVHESGYAGSLVVLGFAGYLGFPVIAGALAGDIFASEDRYGTWKTVLTRSCTVTELFAGKVLTVAALAVGLTFLTALSSLAAGLLFTGGEPLVGLGGTAIPAGHALYLVSVSWLLSILPVLGFVALAVLFSVATRNGIIGVLGPLLVALLMALLQLIGSGTWAHTLLLSSAFDDWHGLLAAPAFYGPTLVGSLVSVIWILACLTASLRLLRGRDFAGPPVPRRVGWAGPLRAVLVGVAVIVVLALAGGWGPAGVTSARLEASIARTFSSLTIYQQQELGRSIPHGEKLGVRTRCSRRSGASAGPGDDWSCVLTVVGGASAGNDLLSLTPVVYDVSVKSEGCYKAQSPPTFVGKQQMTDAAGQVVVNPLFTIYSCFDVNAPAGCPEGTACSERAAPPASGATERTPRPPVGVGAKPTAAERRAEAERLKAAERAAGPRVVKEIAEAEERTRAEKAAPEGQEPTPAG